jgi:hypothetical protein
MDLVLTLVCCVSEPALVYTFWLCTSLDVEAGLCNPLSKKMYTLQVINRYVHIRKVVFEMWE